MKYALIALILCGCQPRPINEGATGCLLYPYVNSGMLADMDPGRSGELKAIFAPGDPCRIYVDSPIDPPHLRLLHEYQHYMEWSLRAYPDAQKVARHAFRGLMADGFEYGAQDLMGEIP